MRERGRKKKKMIFVPVVALCGVIILCIILTGMILWSMMPEKTTKIGEKDYDLENVYIIGNIGDRVRVCYGDKLYDFSGKLEKDYSGIGDLKVRKGRIVRCIQKPDTVEGVLISYTSKQMEIGELGSCQRNRNLPVYRKDGDQVAGGSMKDLIVGVSRLTYVFEKGRICALIQNGQQKIDSVRVLIRNGEDVKYKELYVSAEESWMADGQQKQKGEVCSAKDLFRNNKKEAVKIYCDKGMLYICDKEGKRLGNTYKGNFTVQKVKKGYVLVNELPMETYVSYVLPSEMDPDYELEALKAQAICARTFAYTQMKGEQYAGYGANLDDSTDYQVYNKGSRTTNSDRAVAETAGQLLASEGKPARCYYYSTSPGVTGDLSLWEDDPVSYLKPVNCLKKGDPGSLAGKKAFLDFINKKPDSWDSDSPYYRWDAVVELSGVCDDELGNLKEIKVKKRNKNGYIGALKCIYEKGKRVLKNENRIRTLLGKGMVRLTLSDKSSREFSLLPSACFAVTKSEGGRLYIRGGGFGHGIGMSQCGAGALGAAGKSCQEILSFYYPGTQIINSEKKDSK